MRIISAAVVFSFVAAMTGDVLAQSTDCRLGKPQQVAELMFGRKIGDRIGVSEAQWARFLDREITRRFPDGLTVIDTRGQWRDTVRKTIVREPSKLVQIVLPGKPEDDARLNEIAAAYKSRFRQQSVGIIVRAACVSF
jgi:Protein of unknown function (DUF3574)